MSRILFTAAEGFSSAVKLEIVSLAQLHEDGFGSPVIRGVCGGDSTLRL